MEPKQNDVVKYTAEYIFFLYGNEVKLQHELPVLGTFIAFGAVDLK